MTEEARKIVKALRNNIRDGFYWIGNAEFSMPCAGMINLIESLSAENEILNAAIGQLGAIECHRDMLEHELEQVTRERDAAFRHIKRGCRACSACRYGDDTPENNEVCDKCIPNPEGYSEWQWEGVEVNNDGSNSAEH